MWPAAMASDELPSRDTTGKVHGDLPKAEDIERYSAEELEHFRTELEHSVDERIRKTVQLGSEKGRGERQAAEQALIQRINKCLKDRGR